MIDGTSHAVFHPQPPEEAGGIQPCDEVTRYGYAVRIGGRLRRDIRAPGRGRRRRQATAKKRDTGDQDSGRGKFRPPPGRTPPPNTNELSRQVAERLLLERLWRLIARQMLTEKCIYVPIFHVVTPYNALL
jgi:hypothetical protein